MHVEDGIGRQCQGLVYSFDAGSCRLDNATMRQHAAGTIRGETLARPYVPSVTVQLILDPISVILEMT